MATRVCWHMISDTHVPYGVTLAARAARSGGDSTATTCSKGGSSPRHGSRRRCVSYHCSRAERMALTSLGGMEWASALWVRRWHSSTSTVGIAELLPVAVAGGGVGGGSLHPAPEAAPTRLPGIAVWHAARWAGNNTTFVDRLRVPVSRVDSSDTAIESSSVTPNRQARRRRRKAPALPHVHGALSRQPVPWVPSVILHACGRRVRLVSCACVPLGVAASRVAGFR